MELSLMTIFSVLDAMLFVGAVAMHFSKKNVGLINIYLVQSLSIFCALLLLAWHEQSAIILISAIATGVVKLAIVPRILLGLIRKHKVTFTSGTYASTPVLLFAIVLIVTFAHSSFAPILAVVAPESSGFLFLTFSMVLTSLLLTINRKGAISQILGILSAENGVVALALSLNIHGGIGMELGIIFDVVVLVLVSSTFASIVAERFGTMDVSEMRNLAE
jgi:hydrogenase-4 component E